MAARTTLAVAATLAIAFPLARAAAQPPTVPLLAVSVAMTAAIAITGVTWGAQLRSTAFAALVAAAAVALGALLAPYPLPGYAAFVAVMAAAAWAGGFGPGGRGLGLLGFMTFFFALFTRATVQNLPALLAAAALGAAVAGVMRIVVIRDAPERRLRHLVVALRARLEDLSARAEQVRAGAPVRGGDPRARLADDAVRIDEVVLPLHDLLRDAPETVARERAFRGHLFAVVTLGHLLVLRALEGRETPAETLAAPPLDPAERLQVHLGALEAAAAGRPEPSIHDARTLEDEEEPEVTPEPAAGPPAPLWARGAPRTALQVAVAGAVAVAVGHLLSPHRWYWAGIAAFVVFVNTGSRGATLRRAVERMLGTAAGIAGGMLAGYLLAGRSALELAAIFPILFVGYWMLQASQVAMVGMITILFALMYDLMGMLTLHLMLLRLAETVIGAAAGAAAAYFILPARTRTALDEAFAGYFAAMDGLLQAVAVPPRTGGSDRALLAGVQGLDRAVGTLRAAIQPLIASVPGRRSRALQRQLVLALTARYWVNRLVGRLLFHTHAVDEATLGARVERARARIAPLLDGSSAAGAPSAATVMAGSAEGVEGAPLVRAEAVLAELARARAGAPPE